MDRNVGGRGGLGGGGEGSDGEQQATGEMRGRRGGGETN